MARKRPRRNKSKKRSAERLRRTARCARAAAMLVGAGAVLLLTSALFILIYDILTQSDVFPVAKITVSGANRLTEQQVLAQADVQPGANILAVNLSAVRKRLISHPWIADAQLRREIPAGLWIRIREHQSCAIVDLGDKFLLNQEGQVFKQWQPGADPGQLPVVKGLTASDLTAAALPRTDNRLAWPGSAEAASQQHTVENHPLAAVMQVLDLGRVDGSSLPNRQLSVIEVDRAMGLTLHAFIKTKVINLGYEDYPEKYRMLATMLKEAKANRLVPDFTHIDLQDISRIVIKPAKQEPS